MPKDHYVPQFYLRNFSPWRKKNQIYLYRRALTPELVGIATVAFEHDYYADRVDKTLGRQEIESAQIITKLLAAPQIELSAKERKRLSAFIGTLANRTPNSQERLFKRHSFVVGSLEDFLGDTDEFFRCERAKGYSGTDEELDILRLEYLESARQNYLRYQPGKTDDGLIETALEIASDTETVIEERQWHLLETVASKVFVTSDNPVVQTRPENEVLWRAIGLRRGSVLLPLSKSRCLLIDDFNYGNKLLSVRREQTAQINALVIAGAHEAVFANLVSKDIAKVFDGTVRGENTDLNSESLMKSI